LFVCFCFVVFVCLFVCFCFCSVVFVCFLLIDFLWDPRFFF
jgi:hypothetical protein